MQPTTLAVSSIPPIEHPEPPREAQPAGSSETPAAPPTAKAGREPWLVRGLVLALVGAIISWIASGLPRPFDHTEPSGQVTIGNILRNQTLAMFRAQALQPGPGEERGLSLEVRRSAEHVSTNGCRLVWTLLDANGPTPVPDRSLVAQPAKWVSSDPHSCVTDTMLWVPLGPGLGTVDNLAVQVQLFAGEHLLDTATSKPIPLG